MQRVPPYAIWIGLFIVMIVLLQGVYLPPLLLMLLLGGGGYLLYLGWRIWGGSGPGATKVTYWRGQRIELPAERGQALPPARRVGPALPYLIAGGVLVATSVAMLVS